LQLLVVGILIILILLGFTIFAFRNKNKLALDLAYKNEVIENINRELLTTNDKLQKLIKEKSSLMYVVSHDLKAPFSRITGFMELMIIDAKNQDFYIKMINMVLHDGSTLIQNLLDNAELEEGSRKFKIAEIRLNNLLNDLVISYAQYTKLKNIELLYPDFEGAEIIIYNESFSLTRILDNLITNALKFSPEQTQVVVDAKLLNSDKLLLSVKDFGPGISKDEQEILFQAFQKGNAQPTGGESSSGLGLSIVKGLVDKMNGKIWVESILGHGATFYVEIPRTIKE